MARYECIDAVTIIRIKNAFKRDIDWIVKCDEDELDYITNVLLIDTLMSDRAYALGSNGYRYYAIVPRCSFIDVAIYRDA